MLKDGAIPYNAGSLNGDISLEELERYAHYFTMRCWGVPFNGRIELINREWKRKSACFLHNGLTIQFSHITNQSQSMNEVLKVLLHELVHWRLYTTGEPCEDDTKEFVEEALRVGASFSGAKKAQETFQTYF